MNFSVIPGYEQDKAREAMRRYRASILGEITITVLGTPGPQGSKSAKGSYTDKLGRRHVRLVESSKKVKPWRAAVVEAAELWMRGRAWEPWDCPLIGSVIFTLRKPQRPKAPVPDRYPDLSKILRSTEDALTTAGIWKDDARVVEYEQLAKRYPDEGEDALPEPGAIIRIRPLRLPDAVPVQLRRVA